MSLSKSFKHTEETKTKISQASIGHLGYWKGKHPSIETRRKISEALKGIKRPPFSEEHKRKMSIARKGKTRTPFSREHKRKLSEAMRGNKNPSWKGGRRLTVQGYIKVLLPTHPHADCEGYILEHHLIIEKHLDRILLPNEVVHHINGIKDDNRIENLMLLDNTGKHTGLHNKKRRKDDD